MKGLRKAIKKKHPLAIRWFHWVNFPILALMTWSGLLIYWANDVYSVTLFGHTFYKFFPDAVYKLFHIPFRLAEGMAFHFVLMWLFFLNGILYVAYTAFSGEWRYLLPNGRSLKEAWQVVLHDLHIRKTVPLQDKYNAAQRIAYSGIIVMGAGSILTGLAIYKPVQLYWLCWLLGGYHAARIIHFILTMGYILFFVVHIVQVILAGWNNFRSVITGFEVVPVPNPGPAAVPVIPGPIAAGQVMPAEPVPQKVINRRTFISFSVFAGASATAFGAWKWLYNAPMEKPGITRGARAPLRRALNKNELLFRRLFSGNHLVETYPKSMAAPAHAVRLTGDLGLRGAMDAGGWKLEVDKVSEEVFYVSLEEIRALPKTEITYTFKCIEGWDQISHWAGVKFSDFLAHYDLTDEIKMQYVGFSTPDDTYYVGIDMPSALHPQTLLAYEMNDQPLTAAHGAPLRLIIPVKYGIKNLKRIGSIVFSDARPHDYWAEQGYDYYSGL
jgi:DMSO/TMAO reductase YedYZ molybdopterin-dependent catalytic subunit/thiosulfate reductase cytochrome b subunit